GGAEDPLRIQVAVGRRTASNEIGLLGDGGVEGRAVSLGVDRHAPDPQLAQRAEDPDRDLAAIGDKNLSEWRHGRAYSVPSMHFADQLTLARAFSVPVVVVLYAWDFPNHYYWATAVFSLRITTAHVHA